MRRAGCLLALAACGHAPARPLPVRDATVQVDDGLPFAETDVIVIVGAPDASAGQVNWNNDPGCWPECREIKPGQSHQ